MAEQFYGIKYPFSEESERLTFFDLNESKSDSVKSMILHIIFTPKGQRLRRPEFGTDLIKFIFSPNDNDTWEKIKSDIQKQIALYLPEVIFKNIVIKQSYENGEDNGIFVEIDYTVDIDGANTENKILVRV